MVKRTSEEDIWYWHEQIEKFKSQNNSQAMFCRDNNIHYKKFISKYRRIVYVQKTNPSLYATIMPHAKEFINSGMSVAEYCTRNDILSKDLSEACSHLRYLETIETMKNKHEDNPMKFIQVPAAKSKLALSQEYLEPEVMKKQNDVELIISKGVKVVVAPEVGADKLVRIIELLKDL